MSIVKETDLQNSTKQKDFQQKAKSLPNNSQLLSLTNNKKKRRNKKRQHKKEKDAQETENKPVCNIVRQVSHSHLPLQYACNYCGK